jgi:integrase/recombinase XerD
MERIKPRAISSKARKEKDEDRKKDEFGAKDHLTKDEVYRLAEAAPEPHVRNELLIKMMFWTGPRVSEVLRVDIGDDGTLDGPGSDIDPDKPRIVYYSSKSDEAYPMSYPRQEINPLLRDWVRNGRLRYKRATDTNRLFVGRKGPTSKSRVSDMIDKAAKGAGLQEPKRECVDGRTYHRVTPHILRHSFAMHYLNEKGVPLGDIKDALNHSSVETTEDFYAESTEERMIDVFGG